jgi:hypothetical protein
MATDVRQLYWPGPFRGLYQQLQAASPATEPRLRELLASRQEWLLAGTARWRPPSDASRAAAADAFKAGKLVLGPPPAAAAAADGGAAQDKAPPAAAAAAQRVKVDPRLEQAALEMSAVLVRRLSYSCLLCWWLLFCCCCCCCCCCCWCVCVCVCVCV